MPDLHKYCYLAASAPLNTDNFTVSDGMVSILAIRIASGLYRDALNEGLSAHAVAHSWLPRMFW
jgi:hypothetical protein